jgi:hypothetical protein
MTRMKTFAILLMSFTLGIFAQTPAPKSVLGTVLSVRAASAEIEVKPETGDAVLIRISSATLAKKVAPGQTDLSKAESIAVTDVIVGDRVLVTMGAPDPAEARRIIVIPASDLVRRDAADKADWQKRGVSGVVTAVSGAEVTVEARSLGGAAKFTVVTGPKTTYKRYASDSIRFADAKNSGLTEITVGDQLRARGQKNSDGTKIDAEDVVFGTFLSRAGTITAVNSAAREITLKDLANNKPLTVKFLADSQIKRMPEMAAGGRGGTPPNGSGPSPQPSPPAPAQGRGSGPSAGAAPGRGSGRGAGTDIGQMLESLPPLRFEDLKNGEIVVVSAIRGARPDQITAITFLANAEVLVQLAMQARGVGANGPAPSLAGLAGSISSVP